MRCLLDVGRFEPALHRAGREWTRAAIPVSQRSAQLLDISLHHVANTVLEVGTVAKATLSHLAQGVFLAPALHDHPVHGGHQASPVRTVFAVHQHRTFGFGSLNGAKGLEYIRVIHVIGAIRQLHLIDTGRGQPA